jgi:hypothetical protein
MTTNFPRPHQRGAFMLTPNDGGNSSWLPEEAITIVCRSLAPRAAISPSSGT